MATKLQTLSKKANDLREQINSNERRTTELKQELNQLQHDIKQLETATDTLLNFAPTDHMMVAFNKTFGTRRTYHYLAFFYGGFWYVTQNGSNWGEASIPKRSHKAFIDWLRRGESEEPALRVLVPAGTLQSVAEAMAEAPF